MTIWSNMLRTKTSPISASASILFQNSWQKRTRSSNGAKSSPADEVKLIWVLSSGWMESWGRGIANIMDACEQAGLPKPEFIKAPWITRIIFRFKTPLTPYLSGNPSNIPSIEGLNEGIKETYRIVRSHPGINAPQIAVLTGKSLATIERHLSALRKKGLIGHQDSKRTGGYYVK